MQTGKLMSSPEKQKEIDLSVVVHLAEVKGDFDNGTLDEDYVLNMDETNFHLNLVNGRTHDFEGMEDVNGHCVRRREPRAHGVLQRRTARIRWTGIHRIPECDVELHG